jgi:hypothetical protein
MANTDDLPDEIKKTIRLTDTDIEIGGNTAAEVKDDKGLTCPGDCSSLTVAPAPPSGGGGSAPAEPEPNPSEPDDAQKDIIRAKPRPRPPQTPPRQKKLTAQL